MYIFEKVFDIPIFQVCQKPFQKYILLGVYLLKLQSHWHFCEGRWKIYYTKLKLKYHGRNLKIAMDRSFFKSLGSIFFHSSLFCQYMLKLQEKKFCGQKNYPPFFTLSNTCATVLSSCTNCWYYSTLQALERHAQKDCMS